MLKQKIAVLGSGSIGKFHVREFHNAGYEVTSILGSSIHSSKARAEELKKEFNIGVRPYFNLDTLLKNEKLDAVSVCTPAELHSYQVRKCLESNLHVFCEKPFVFDSLDNNYEIAKDLIKLSKDKGKILTVNNQLVSILEQFPKHLKFGKIKTFSIYMESSIRETIKLISEAVPHMNSLLIRLISDKKISNIKFIDICDESAKIKFEYGECNVEYNFKLKEDRPRKYNFSINDVNFNKGGSYEQQKIIYGNRSFNIEDPLKISIERFVSALTGEGRPLITEYEILKNVEMQDKIINAYLSQNLKH